MKEKNLRILVAVIAVVTAVTWVTYLFFRIGLFDPFGLIRSKMPEMPKDPGTFMFVGPLFVGGFAADFALTTMLRICFMMLVIPVELYFVISGVLLAWKNHFIFKNIMLAINIISVLALLFMLPLALSKPYFPEDMLFWISLAGRAATLVLLIGYTVQTKKQNNRR